MMIARQTIDEVLQRASITEVVGGVVQLKRQGSNLVGLCPFHSEKGPSFHVRENVGSYHCFGCGASGNTISFVMKSRGVTFPEAVEELAARYNIPVIREGGDKPRNVDDTAEKKALLFRVQALAADYFQEQLRSSRVPPEVAAYIKERGLTKDSIDTFGIGFAPKAWRGLTDYLLSKKVPEDLLALSGLVKKNDRGEFYDVFRGRLMFPIMLDRGRVVAFGGRLIPALHTPEEKDSIAKYFNSPETLIYKKQDVLYGLEQAITGLRADKRAVIVEGYLDVISLHQVGMNTAVATCGTALTAKHVKRLAGLCKSVLVLFDGDTAGRSAAGKSFETFINGGVDSYAVFLPPEHDPDSFAKKYGEQTKSMIMAMSKKTLLDCFLELKLIAEGAPSFGELGAAAKGRIASQATQLIAQVKNPVERAEMLSKVAARLAISENTLSALEPSPTPNPGPDEEQVGEVEDSGGQPSVIKAPVDLSPLDRELVLVLAAQKESFPQQLLADPQLCSRIGSEVAYFAQELVRIFSGDRTKSRLEPESARKEAVIALLNKLGSGWKGQWKKAYEMLESGADFDKVIDACRRKAVKGGYEEELKRLDQEFKNAQNDEDKMAIAQEQLSIQKLLQGYSSI